MSLFGTLKLGLYERLAIDAISKSYAVLETNSLLVNAPDVAKRV